MKAIIMAAGKGTRLAKLGKPMPKVLRESNGKPLLSYVFDVLEDILPEDITVVTGYMAQEVEDAFADFGCSFIRQGDEAYGTGYAVMCGIKDKQFENYHGDIIILNGDAPLITKETVNGLKKMQSNGNDCTLLSCITDIKLPYGRIIRSEDGGIIDIREEKECTEEEKLIKELNVGSYIFNSDALRLGLSMINNNNNAHEYYLTDVPPAIARCKGKVDAYITRDENELLGVNTPEDLIEVSRILSERR
ncbi:MAG: NTP transferase domain-containing protein [Clostridia bacterium]|nr:NTP transferase domain-containing protein [Clostridia bacterium]